LETNATKEWHVGNIIPLLKEMKIQENLFSEIKVMHHINVGITGTIRRNLQRTTISYKHIQLHMEK
ncbi:hypothetical protein T01_15523, partial [Trichinella spiralis]